MDGEILRGEVYWVCLDDSVGAEEKTGRPAVVISSNGLNDKQDTVIVAFLTLSGFASATRPSIVSPDGRNRRVICDQIRTVDKTRLTKYESTLKESELIRVTGALASAMCIPIAQPNKIVTAPKQNDELPALKAELDMWKRMYTLTMDQLVELRVNATITERTKAKEVVHPIKTALPEPDPGFEDEPPKKTETPKKTDPPKKTEPPKKVEWDGVKVNINDVNTAAELKEKTGMAYRSACEIVQTRKVVGAYEKVEDLLALEHFGEIAMKRYGHMLEV